MTDAKASSSQRDLPALLALVGVAAIGCVLVLRFDHWRYSASTLFLMFGWVGIVGAAWFLWTAFWAVATGASDADDHIEVVSHGLRGDLVREKEALKRAIKDVEFDRDMGKMSDAQAAAITRVYRRRAKDIIRTLEAMHGAAQQVRRADRPIEELIELELAVRLGEQARLYRDEAPTADVAPPAPTGGSAAVQPGGSDDEGSPDGEAPSTELSTEPAASARAASPAADAAANEVGAADDASAQDEAEETARLCPGCRTRNESDALFCKKCGDKLPTEESA